MAQFQYIQICEDIREEIGEKFSLLGVYEDKIILPQLPFLFHQLAFYCKFDDVKEDDVFNFYIKTPSKEIKIINDYRCDSSNNTKRGIFNVFLRPFQIVEIGNYEAVAKIGNDEYKREFTVQKIEQ